MHEIVLTFFIQYERFVPYTGQNAHAMY